MAVLQMVAEKFSDELDRNQIVDASLSEVREALDMADHGLWDEIGVALDTAQGEVHGGDVNESYVLIRIKA